MDCKIIIFALFLLINISTIFGRKYSHEEELQSEQRYVLIREYDEDTEIITFEVKVKTNGWVGLGLSVDGQMKGADIVIGRFNNGEKLFEDRHGVGEQLPEIDSEQNWVLLNLTRNEGITTMKVERNINTCDLKHDIEINSNLLRIIWAYGETDNLIHHGEARRGNQQLNLLDPSNPPLAPDTITHEVRLNYPTENRNKTIYWVNYRKIDKFAERPLYLIGFDPSYVKSSPASLAHTHHYVVSRCMTPNPEDLDATYEPLLSDGWESAEDVPERRYCMGFIYGWAVGGKEMIFPEHLAFTMGLYNGIRINNEYIMTEVHFDNQNNDILNYETGFDMKFSPVKREEEAGMLVVGINVNPTHLLPPKTLSYTSSGHCSPECTQQMIPSTGIKIFNVMHHAHLAGQSMKFRHFRGNKELPWISYDFNYDFDFQQNRPLSQEVEILPGDQLTIECTYNTTGRVNVSMSGEATTDEMCQAIFWYYPHIPLMVCVSEHGHNMTGIFNQFGIESFEDWSEMHDDYFFDPIVKEPEWFKGQRLRDVLNSNLTIWTEEFIRKFEEQSRYYPQLTLCEGIPTNYENENKNLNTALMGTRLIKKGKGINDVPTVKYPNIDKNYTPENTCSNSNTNIVENFLIFSILLIFYFGNF